MARRYIPEEAVAAVWELFDDYTDLDESLFAEFGVGEAEHRAMEATWQRRQRALEAHFGPKPEKTPPPRRRKEQA